MSGDAERGEVAMADKTGPTALRDTRPTISRTTWLVIVLLAFVGQVAWAVENNFLNLFVQDSFGASLQDVALMVSASALTATLTTLFVGAWSDRVRRRKVFVVAGAALWGVSIIGFAAIQGISDALSPDAAQAARMGVTLTIIFDCVMTFFGSLSNDAAFNAWLTGVTDETNRGRVEGVNSAMPLIAMLAVFGGAMALMHVGDDGTVTYDYPSLFVAVGVLVGAAAVVAGVLMRDSHPAPTVEQAWLHGVARGFSPAAMRENPVLYLVLLGYCIFSTALQVFMPYYVLYLRLPYVLGEGYVFVMAPGIVIAAVFTIFYGRRLDRLGFERAVRLPLALFVAGCLVLTLLTSVAGVFVGSVLMLCGYLGAVACFAAEVRNNTPADRAGVLQGVRTFMVVLVPMLVGPWIGSAVSSGSGAIGGFGVVGDGFTPSSLIFLAGALVSLAVVPTLAAIGRRRTGGR